MRLRILSLTWIPLAFALAPACGDDTDDADGTMASCEDVAAEAAAFIERNAACTEDADCQALLARCFPDNTCGHVALNGEADLEEWSELTSPFSEEMACATECNFDCDDFVALCIDSACEVPGPGSCIESVTVLSGVDVVGSVGQSAADVLAQAEGLYTGELSWLENVVSHEYMNTVTPVEVEVGYAGGEIRDVQMTNTPCVEGYGCHPCDDRLEVDVSLSVVSEDGGASEQLVVALEQTDATNGPAGPSVYHPFDPDAVAGGIERADLIMPPDATLLQLILTAEFSDGTCAGSINAEAEAVGGVGFGPIATWVTSRP